MTDARGAVVCAGLTTVDLVHLLDTDVVAGSKMVARVTTVDVGGPAANAARTAALLGSSVVLHTLLGSGPLAAMARSILERDGVTVHDHTPDDDPWSLPVSSVLVTPDGERTVVSSNALGAPVPGAEFVPPGSAAVVLVDGHHDGLAGAVIGAHPGAYVVLDGGSWKPGLSDILPRADLALVSADFRPPAGGDPGVRADAVWARTHGAGPVEVVQGDGRWVLPVPPVAVVDTLGAGDVLHGAVAHALAAGLATDPREAIRWAIPVAARSCAYRGVTTWAGPTPGAATR